MQSHPNTTETLQSYTNLKLVFFISFFNFSHTIFLWLLLSSPLQKRTMFQFQKKKNRNNANGELLSKMKCMWSAFYSLA